MKSVIKNGESTTNSYPCLKKAHNENGKIIVLFSKAGAGIIIWSNRAHQKVGHFNTVWCEENFIEFNGTIELSNK